MTTSKTIPVMTTCKELIAFFEAIPTERSEEHTSELQSH